MVEFINDKTPHAKPKAKWGPWTAVGLSLVLFFVSQITVGFLIALYGVSQHWSQTMVTAKLKNSVTVQFWYVLLTEAILLALLWLFLRTQKAHPRDLGLKHPRWKDLGLALAGYGFYFVVFIITVIVVQRAVPGFNINQKQELGFSTGATGRALILVAISLVVLPPIAEEILFRGFLFTGLRSKLPFITSALITSTIFGAAHLPEGSGGLLWIGAVDTMVLSLVLCYLRETTGSLWASMGVHLIKNGLAFASVFIFHVI